MTTKLHLTWASIKCKNQVTIQDVCTGFSVTLVIVCEIQMDEMHVNSNRPTHKNYTGVVAIWYAEEQMKLVLQTRTLRETHWI